jgi:EAL domain-containing protein (putative c-di-GMP-specific phosphodiesterase class I)
MLEALGGRGFSGHILPVGPRDSVLVTAARQFCSELGLTMMPTLPTPFSASTLHDSVAMLLPASPPPSPAIDVGEALKAGWLELWYQHKIDVRTLAPRGAEAVLRLRHPAWGVVAPGGLIAEDDDRNFLKLSEFSIGHALEDWRHFLHRHGPLDLSINLPSAALMDPNGLRALCAQMPNHPAFGGLLIEIGDADTMADIEPLAEAARRIRFHNIAVAVDHLGADWPALMRLDGMPFTELKVDRQFVTGMADNPLKRAVCRGIVDFAAARGARSVAIGIKTRADFLAAHEIGFDLVQGCLFGKPMAAKKFARAALSRPVTMAP